MLDGCRHVAKVPATQFLVVRWRWFHVLLLVVLHLSASQQVAGNRALQQQPPQVIEYNPLNKTVKVQTAIKLPNTNFPGAVAEAIATYPDPQFENPNGWRFKVVSNASVVLGSNTSGAVRIDSAADSKLAPAIALASADVESSGSTIVLSKVAARARPGLQYGVTLAKTDAKLVSTADFNPQLTLANGPTLFLLNQNAEAGQGQVVNLVNADLNGNNLALGDSRTKSIASRWYMSPGHAIQSQIWKIKGGQAAMYSKSVTRASQGTASSGVYHQLLGRGNIPASLQFRKIKRRNARFLAKHGAIGRADNRAFVDAGAAQAGNIQLIKAENGDSTAVGLSQARTAEGNAAAGALNIGWAENGYVYIGDYWGELSNPGNAVVSTNYGRGPAESGQVNIALTPNAGARIGGTSVATAVQGSASSGAFTLANGYGLLETDEDVVAITSEYTASAANVGVSVSHQRSSVINSAVAKSDTGSAIALDDATAVVGGQNSAVGSSTATTADGQAASAATVQAVSGVQAESQGSSLARTTTGNALSVGDAFSGSMYVSRTVSTSAATTQDGTSLSSGFSGALGSNSEAATASSAVTSGEGNAASVARGLGLGVFKGKGTAASSAGSRGGSTASLAIGVGTGLILSDSNVASTAQSADGAATSHSGSLALGGITSSSKATSLAQAFTGDAAARADSVGIGSLHGQARAQAVSASGCPDCVSDAVANAISVGIVADSTAEAKSDSPLNPGNSLANAMAFGVVSRTSNGGSSRVALGPGQALAGGFAVSAPRRIADAAAAAAAAKDLAKKAAGLQSDAAVSWGRQQGNKRPSSTNLGSRRAAEDAKLEDFLVKRSVLHSDVKQQQVQQQQVQQQQVQQPAAPLPKKPQLPSMSTPRAVSAPSRVGKIPVSASGETGVADARSEDRTAAQGASAAAHQDHQTVGLATSAAGPVAAVPAAAVPVAAVPAASANSSGGVAPTHQHHITGAPAAVNHDSGISASSATDSDNLKPLKSQPPLPPPPPPQQQGSSNQSAPGGHEVVLSVKDSPQAAGSPLQVPGSGFMAGLLSKLQTTVQVAEEIGATESFGEAFSANTGDLPLFALQPLDLQGDDAEDVAVDENTDASETARGSAQRAAAKLSRVTPHQKVYRVQQVNSQDGDAVHTVIRNTHGDGTGMRS